MILVTANTSLQVVLGGSVTTNQLPFVTAYEVLYTNKETSWNTEHGVTNNSTAVTLLAAPAQGEKRRVITIAIRNQDTVSQTVTVRYNDNGTTRNLVVIEMGVGDSLCYSEPHGWYVLNATGNLRTTGGIDFAATQAEQEAGSTATKYTSPARQQFHPSAAKAWASWNDAGSLNTKSYNVSSITDTGTGNWTANLSITLSHSDPVCIPACGDNGGRLVAVGTRTATTVQVLERDVSATLADSGYQAVAVYGDI